MGTLKFQLKKTVQHWHVFKDHRALHLLRGYSDNNWERQVTIEMITKMTEPYILWGDIQIPIDRTSHLLLGHSNSTGKNSSVPKWFQKSQKRTSFSGTLKFQLKNTVQYWNDFKDHRTLHPLRGDSDPNWKRQVSIEMITKMTEPYILCGDNQIPTEKKQFSIKMILKITDLYILCRDIQVST